MPAILLGIVLLWLLLGAGAGWLRFEAYMRMDPEQLPLPWSTQCYLIQRFPRHSLWIAILRHLPGGPLNLYAAWRWWQASKTYLKEQR